MASGIVGVQRVSDEKLKEARKFRKNMTNAEALLWEHLRGRRCGSFKFRRQQVIEGFITDFYCEEAKLVIELDGSIHERTDVAENDRHRENVFKARGILTIRFSNNEIEKRMDNVLQKIILTCKTRIADLNKKS
jgi:very-short-patch-repair endonuclease